MTLKLGITLPKSIIQTIDQERGYIPRSRYIRRVIERYLGNSSNKDIGNNDNKTSAAKKVGENRKMSGIEGSVMPFVNTIGFGGIVGFLIGFRPI
jgi:metal-responsive CopG/Arc/MetJ family transcriptional regulator